MTTTTRMRTNHNSRLRADPRLLHGARLILHSVLATGRGALPAPHGRARVESDDRTAWIEFTVALDESGQRIERAKFRAAGPPTLTAAGSVLCRLVGGLPLREARHVKREHVVGLLGAVPLPRQPLVGLALRALRTTISNAAHRRFAASTPWSKVASRSAGDR